MEKSSCKVHVVIDCDFDNYMEDKDIKALVKQIQFSYSANRRAKNPLQFYCCNVGGKCRERLESVGDYKGWDIKFHEASYSSLFEKSSLVYLSSESPNILETLEEDKVYIIGGLVDHNHHKGLCHKLAEEKGYAHAQLPIGDYIDMKTRKVLAINHVFEILLRYTESHDWQKAFYSVLPPRKGAVPKQLAETRSESENAGDKRESENSDADDDLVKDDQTGLVFDGAVNNDQEVTGNDFVDIISKNSGNISPMSKSADKTNGVADTNNFDRQDSVNNKAVELPANNKAELTESTTAEEAKGE
ncbi:tRNA methyltransferase 10 homolog A-like isoform X2 [Dreissena polymorpha]|nr:tRNA methyltransferase 10 homolog A-like isoform X2 [Dreissena polymorpha]XP_052263282.1 tRNA methyltransferase 10 homolog A-like isoform X2 [Dreissena polymorpha]